MSDDIIPEDFDDKTGSIVPSILLEDEMKQSYLDYAMSVIVSRALCRCARRIEACASPHSLRDARGRIYIGQAL
jgi:hypothetical protein